MIRKIKKRDGRVVDFDKSKIAEAIFEAAKAVGGRDFEKAVELSKKVVNQLEKKGYDGKIPTVEDVQDTVEKVLIEEGHAKTAKAYILYREQHKNIRETTKLLRDIGMVDDYLGESDWEVKENSNMTFSLQGLNVYITDKVVKNYWLNNVYPKEIRESHKSGDFHIHDLGTLGAYTYFGKEVVIAKLDDEIMVTSFQNLYNLIKAEEKTLSKKDNAIAKHPDNLYVLDKNGWTKATRLVKKSKDRKMHFIKNEGGRSVIVTEDHPMVIGKEKFKEAKKIEKEKDKLLTINLKKILGEKNLFNKKKIYLAKELVKKGRKDFFIEGMPCEEFKKYQQNWEVEGIISTSNNADSLPNKIELTENLGYLLGFYLAEGWMDTHKIGIKQKEIKENSKIFKKLKKAAWELGCRLYTRKKGDNNIMQIANSTFVNYLLKEVFGAEGTSREKRLPNEIILYNKDFVKGVIGGIVDGDGSITTSKTSLTIRISSRTLLEQLVTLLNLLGFTARDRNLEGVGTTHKFDGKTIKQNYPLYGISFRVKKEKKLPSVKYKNAKHSSSAWRKENYDWHKVLNNSSTDIQDDYIYDITTKSHTLIVNGMWNHNCVGWDLLDILKSGFRGVRGKIQSKPAKHFNVALMQVVNFMYTLQGESAGAQALSNFDTLLAPFIRYDNLNYKKVKQTMQEFMFNMNVPTRVGFQTPFSNVTMDLKCPKFMKKDPVIIGGEPQDETYGDFQKEMDMFNRAFAEVIMEGDAKGRPFTFPIPTYNITKEFSWDNDKYQPIWEMTAKYGIPYFSNFVNSDMSPKDVRSMCCRLRLSNRELKKRGGGLFGANPLTGCYDEKTEVLTENGWKLFKNVKEDERVFTLSENNKIELHKPTKYFEYDYDGEMHRFKAKSFDLLVTPNHRMVVDQVGSNKRKFVEARDFDVNNQRIPKEGYWKGEEKKKFIIPPVKILKGIGPKTSFSQKELHTARHMRQGGNTFKEISEEIDCSPGTVLKVCKNKNYGQGGTVVKEIKPELKIDMDNWLRFFGIWMAEGSIDNENIAMGHGYRTVITQGDGETKREIKELLDGLPFNYYTESNGSCVNFVICNKQLWNYLRQFGNKYEKFIPNQIKILSRRQLKILFDWMMKGDGHVRKSTGQINYWTASKNLADDMQEIILKLGWMSTLRKRQRENIMKDGRKIKSNEVYVVGVQQSTHYRFRKRNISKEYYKGKVYCLEVPNHTLLVRRNGKTTWCGNSIGVVTINLARLGYLSENEKDFLNRLEKLMNSAKESLKIKREILEGFTEKGLYPYSRFYLRSIKKSEGEYWKNHFSTIGLIGMNDALLNFMNKTTADKEGEKFAEKVLKFMRKKLSDYQQETDSIFNLEATPAEGTCYRLARKDKQKYPDIKVYNQHIYGNNVKPYYTNSSQLPVDFTNDIFEALKLQDPLQTKYTGGTVLHGFIGESPSPEAVKKLVKAIASNYHLPYYTITPTFSICPEHGYLQGEHKFCPKCKEQGKKTKCEVWSRVVGYLRPVEQWNEGKQEEFEERETFDKQQEKQKPKEVETTISKS